jgi:hypothetical protein
VYIDQRDRYLIDVNRCLANFGPAARNARPAIETVRDDPNSLASVVEMATETLMVIRSEGMERGDAVHNIQLRRTTVTASTNFALVRHGDDSVATAFVGIVPHGLR